MKKETEIKTGENLIKSMEEKLMNLVESQG